MAFVQRKGRCCPLFDRNDTKDKGVGGLAHIPFGASILSDFDWHISFPFPVDIIGIQSFEHGALTANSVITIDVGGTDAATTHTVTATAAGTRLRTAIDPDSDTVCKDIPANTVINVECDGTASAGTADVYLEWRHARRE